MVLFLRKQKMCLLKITTVTQIKRHQILGRQTLIINEWNTNGMTYFAFGKLTRAFGDERKLLEGVYSCEILQVLRAGSRE